MDDGVGTAAAGVAATWAVGRQATAMRWAADVVDQLAGADPWADVAAEAAMSFTPGGPVEVKFQVRDGRNGDPEYGAGRRLATLAAFKVALPGLEWSAPAAEGGDGRRATWVYGAMATGGMAVVVSARFVDAQSASEARRLYGSPAAAGAQGGAGR